MNIGNLPIFFAGLLTVPATFNETRYGSILLAIFYMETPGHPSKEKQK
ncbi:MAG: hypothetical protein ABW168_21925 [Sedimenticola sp.]